ncbi:alpha/beta hydrolase [Aestuariibacter sp. AA17]|uniref:Alpha/beta hydrolase n=1 Tax=Fluctibacter corallii TaxID=2984329 RepID=A0ABT3A565_9ALTE|nr:alpha/beta hydrolase [Aestuariibacter sp. AA17]MCV2883793.1 alpha/beta hydrolase [Aestuariibacter sp. AA17]
MQKDNIEAGIANLTGTTMHYLASGNSESDTVLIFLHGFPENAYAWHRQLAFFSKEYLCIAPDLPGFNVADSKHDAAFYSISNLVSVMVEFISHIADGRRTFLVAHDWGGAIAWPLAAFHASLLSGLVIINAAHPTTFTREMMTNAEQQRRSHYIHTLIAEDAVERIQQNNCEYLQNMLQKSRSIGEFGQEEIEEYKKGWSNVETLSSMLNYYKMMPQIPPLESTNVRSDTDFHLPNIRVGTPTLVLWGMKDRAFVHDVLEGLDKYVSTMTIKTYEHGSHWVHHELSDDVNREIKRHVDLCLY